MKTCTSCHTEKDESCFYRNGGSRRGYRAQCITCVTSDNLPRGRKWRLDNPALARSMVQESRKKNPEAYCHYKKWRIDNREAWLARARRNNAARLARKMGASPKWANEFFIGEAYDLAALRSKMTGVRWEVDHIVPLQSPIVCGLHCDSNLRVITKRENVIKSNKWWPDMPETINVQ